MYENEVTEFDNTKNFVAIMDYIPAKTLAALLVHRTFEGNFKFSFIFLQKKK